MALKSGYCYTYCYTARMKSDIPDTIRRGLTYHFKKRIPKEVVGQPPFRSGQEFVQFSLQTKSPQEALRSMDRAYAKYHRLIEAAQTASEGNSSLITATANDQRRTRQPTADDLGRAVDRFHDRYIAQHTNIHDLKDNREFGSLGDKLIAGKLEDDWLRIQNELETAPFFPDRTLETAGEILEENNWDMDVDGELFELFCDRLRSAELDAIKRILEQSANQIHISSSELRKREAEHRTQNYRISDAVNDYIKAEPEKREMHEKMQTACELWENLTSVTKVADIDQGLVVDFTDMMREMPANAKQRFPNLSPAEAIRANKDRQKPYPTVSPRTIKTNYVGPLSTCLAMAVGRKRARNNPFAGVKVFGSSRKTQDRRPFKIRELKAIFSQPVFQGSHSIKRRNSPGPNIYRDHFYWPAILSLFSGMRADEIANLKVTDIKSTEIKGERKPYFDVPGTKTENALRELPVHPTLIELGFMDYVEAQKSEGHDRLFPDWAKPNGKKRSEGRCIRNFNEKVAAAAIESDRRPTFHCFRHTLLSELESNDFSPTLMAKLAGHSIKETTAGKHYVVPELEKYYERFCSAVKYEGLNIVKTLKKD